MVGIWDSALKGTYTSCHEPMEIFPVETPRHIREHTNNTLVMNHGNVHRFSTIKHPISIYVYSVHICVCKYVYIQHLCIYKYKYTYPNSPSTCPWVQVGHGDPTHHLQLQPPADGTTDMVKTKNGTFRRGPKYPEYFLQKYLNSCDLCITIRKYIISYMCDNLAQKKVESIWPSNAGMVCWVALKKLNSARFLH